ncbi:hypothetical protein T484DRAFT_1981193, partial [Baffinella frigidus]
MPHVVVATTSAAQHRAVASHGTTEEEPLGRPALPRSLAAPTSARAHSMKATTMGCAAVPRE